MDDAVQPSVPRAGVMPEGHVKLIQSLRALADFYEQRPEFPLPVISNLNAFPQESELAAIARRVGKAAKRVAGGGSYFTISKSFGAITLDFNWTRDQVCERVVVGRETVEEKVPVHTTYETRKVERDKVEWHCPKSVINSPSQIEAAIAEVEQAAVVPVAPAAADEDIPF